MAKLLFIFTLLYFSFGLTIQGGVWESVILQVSQSHKKWECYMVMSHDECGKVVHRPCSSCISSVQKITGTPLSSPCQLWRVIKLSRLSHYNHLVT